MAKPFCPNCQGRIDHAEEVAKRGHRATYPAGPGVCCHSYWEGYADGAQAEGEVRHRFRQWLREQPGNWCDTTHQTWAAAIDLLDKLERELRKEE